MHHCSCLHNASALQTMAPTPVLTYAPVFRTNAAMHRCSCLHDAVASQAMPSWAVLSMVILACAMLTRPAQSGTILHLCSAAYHTPDLLVAPASICCVERHTIWHLSTSHIGATALQAMPFLAMVTFTLVVCTIANMLSTVQGKVARMLRLDAKMVILISCASGLVSSAAIFVFTRLIYREMAVALQVDSLPDSLKALGKVRQLRRGLAGG